MCPTTGLNKLLLIYLLTYLLFRLCIHYLPRKADFRQVKFILRLKRSTRTSKKYLICVQKIRYTVTDKKSPNRAKNPRRNFSQQKRHSFRYRRRSTRHKQGFNSVVHNRPSKMNAKTEQMPRKNFKEIVFVQRNSKTNSVRAPRSQI
jgi:hypothetical protein